MDILIGIGVAAMLAAVLVLGWLLEKLGKRGKELATENAKLRNDLHAAINARKAKTRGITGRMRVAGEALIIAFDANEPIRNEIEALRRAIDSEAV